MSWQGIVMIILIAIEVVISAVMDGEKMEGKFSFPVTLIKKAILVLLLYTGGFFS